jgi:TRAP transporter TAXI family solute receptor
MKKILASIIVALSLVSCSDELTKTLPYVLTTATTGGTFYPVGVAIATIVHAKLSESHALSLTAISSAGSLENIKLLRDNQAQFALLTGPFAAWSWSGEGPVSKPQTNLRSVSAIWHNVEHFVLLSEMVTTGEIMDLNNLDGDRYVLGARNSGTYHTGRFILTNLGIDYENKFNLAYMGYGPATSAIQDGNIVGMNIPGGAPVSSITQAFATLGDRLTILNWTQKSLDKVNAKYPLWDWYEFPPGTYPNQTKLIRTVSSPNVLMTRADMPEEVVYYIVKVIWENLATLREIHGATKDMILEKAIDGLAVPLHKGAIRYYREIGLEIPERLIPKETAEPTKEVEGD